MLKASAALALLLLVACGPAQPANELPPPKPGGSDLPLSPPPSSSTSTADDACTKDDDCVIVEMSCCDHCNGGKAGAFAKAHADAHKAKNCEETRCTRRGCGPAVARCDDGHCKATMQSLPMP